MKASDQYLKIVEWSEEDHCSIGTCPGLMLGGIHGDEEARVYRELCQAVEEWIEIYWEDGEPLPTERRPEEGVVGPGHEAETGLGGSVRSRSSTRSNTKRKSLLLVAASAASSAPSRTTVRIVPSTGRITPP